MSLAKQISATEMHCRYLIETQLVVDVLSIDYVTGASYIKNFGIEKKFEENNVVNYRRITSNIEIITI